MASQEWLAARQQGIGGSDAPVVMKVSRWKTPYQLYLEKRGEAPTSEPSPAMEWGIRLEPVVREAYANATGRTVRVPTKILRHPVFDFVLGNVDGVTNDDRLLEVKTSRSVEGWGEPGTDEIPDEYLVQTQHYLSILKFQFADVAALIGGNDFRIYVVEADPELQSLIIEAEIEFWGRVQRGDPPELTTYADVKQRFRHSKSLAMEASSEILEVVEALRRTKDDIEMLERAKEEAQGAVCKFLGEADTLTSGDQVIATWKSGKPVTRIDAKILQQKYPEVYTAVSVTGDPVRRFLLK